MNRPTWLDVRPDIAAALDANKPVVALESTVIAHGLPHPRNLDTAARMEAAIRDQQAVPATIGVIGGRVVVGLSAREIEQLGTAKDVLKASRRDLGLALAAGQLAATTVAATAFVAAAAGIRLFATGGIGGVHRGVEETLDISADLGELARSPVAVVCAGAKAILDLPRTLEYLETAGVPILGYRTDRFPAFYAADSGLRLEHRADTPTDVAARLAGHWQVNSGAGIIVANPPPADTALDEAELEEMIAVALRDAVAGSVGGKAVTPFLLGRLAKLSNGRTLEANVALLESNARLAAEIAAAWAARSA